MFFFRLFSVGCSLQQPLCGQEGAEVECAAALGAANLSAAVDEGRAAGGVLLLALAAGLIAGPGALYWKVKSKSTLVSPNALDPSLNFAANERRHFLTRVLHCLTSDV